MAANPERIVIVGASVAGLAAADTLREGGFEGTVTILSDERHVPYDRPPLSKSMLLAGHGSESTAQALRSEGHFEEQQLDLRIGDAAVGLDIDRRNVVTSNGDVLPYDAVVIACGSRPRVMLTEEGAELPTLRTPGDLAALRTAAAQYRGITVIGSGFIGLEVAASLRERGLEVTVFGATPLPLDRIMGPDVAGLVRGLHTDRGVRLFADTGVESVSGVPGDFTLRLSDGTIHTTDYVVAGIGVVPNTEWLVGSGVALDAGVLCDATGRTNVPDVYAAGDVAHFEHPLLGGRVRVEHWTNALEQGRHVAGNILTRGSAEYAAVPYFWTDQYDRKFQSYGRRQPGDELFLAEGTLDDDEFLVLYGSADGFHCAISCGRPRALRGYRKLLERGGSWAEARALAAGQNQPAPA